jgi:hypothetical protein
MENTFVEAGSLNRVSRVNANICVRQSVVLGRFPAALDQRPPLAHTMLALLRASASVNAVASLRRFAPRGLATLAQVMAIDFWRQSATHDLAGSPERQQLSYPYRRLQQVARGYLEQRKESHFG